MISDTCGEIDDQTAPLKPASITQSTFCIPLFPFPILERDSSSKPILTMDPASLALAVVGLGLQLVQMTTTIREKINAYKSAAHELYSLSEKLENIEVIFHSLEVAFNGYEESSRPWDIVLLRQLYKIMRDCSDKVLRLHDMINMIFASQTRRIKPFGALGALFLQHRGALRKCSNELDQSLASLHSNMTGNIL